jgi:hypothetical protein
MTVADRTQWPNGWYPSCQAGLDKFEAGLDPTEIRNSKPCAYLKSANSKYVNGAMFSKSCEATSYRGKRIKMSGWVKTKLIRGHAQLWVRVDGD